MNTYMNRWLLVLALAAISFTWTGCQEDCVNVPGVVLGTQSFTVEYETEGGRNYVQEIYNPSNLQVTIDYSGGESTSGNFDERLRPGTNADGQFGPFFFTDIYIDSVTNLPLLSTYSRLIAQDYYIKKDTFGTDKLTVQFWISTDACNTKWESIRYFLNDEELPEYDMQENPNIVIVE